MRHFSFKLLLLCILLPPLLYVFTIQAVETHLLKLYTRELENRYLGDTRALLDGTMQVKDAINENIDRYLQSKKLTDLGMVLKVTVNLINTLSGRLRKTNDNLVSFAALRGK